MFSQARNIKKKHRLPTSIFYNKTETSAVYLLKLQKNRNGSKVGAHNFVLFTINGIVIMSAKLLFKGHLTSKCIFGTSFRPKNQRFFKKNSALAFKKRSNQKIKALYL